MSEHFKLIGFEIVVCEQFFKQSRGLVGFFVCVSKKKKKQNKTAKRDSKGLLLPQLIMCGVYQCF